MSIRSKGPVHAIPSLDGLRAISILMLLLAHAVLTDAFPPALAHQMNFPLGALGVRIFFVISGFLITTLLVREEGTRGSISLSAFYKRRFLRILPAYYFYIIIVFALARFATSLKCPLSTYLSAATFTTRLWGYWGGPQSFNQSWCLIHTWSLSVEEQFYILWPTLLIFIPPNVGRRRILVTFIIALAPLMRVLFIHFNLDTKLLIEQLFLTQADSIMFGCMLALALGANEALVSRIFSFRPHLLRLASVLIIYLSPNLASPLIRTSSMYFHESLAAFIPSVQAIAITYLVGSYILVKRGITYRMLNHPLLQRLGVLSYSLYLWQQLFLAAKGTYPMTYWWQMFPQNLGFAFVAALCSYYIIEKPFLAMKSRFSRLKTTNLGVLAGSADEGEKTNRTGNP